MKNYSYQGKTEGIVKVRGMNIRISHKESYELANKIRGMNIEDAKNFLKRVMEKEIAVPYRRYNRGGTAHRKGMGPGRYPIKTSKHFMKVIESLSSNAEQKGMEPSNLVLKHIATHKGAAIPGRYKGSAHNTSVTHIEMVAVEGKEKSGESK